MSDRTTPPTPGAFLLAADRLADRFRSMPQGRLTELAPGGLLLARRLARRAQELEGGTVRPELPEAGVFAVGDQIALAAHDLAAALPPESGASPGEPADPEDPEDSGEAGRMLAEALAEVDAAYRLATTRSARM